MKLHFDPRTKLMCLLLVIIATVRMPNLEWESLVILVICVFGILNGRVGRSIIDGVCFFLAYILWSLVVPRITGVGSVSVVAWLGLVFKLFPGCIMAGIIMGTTKINELLTSMQKAGVSQRIVIPMAVLFRYLPTVREDWGYIKDAFALRGITPSLRSLIMHPVVTVECLYVPLLITASKTADELSIASVTRGIENPGRRSSIVELRIRARDFVAMGIFLVITVLTVIQGVNIV